ncbi:TRAP transporter permease [Paenalcaligenes sp. Me131]|uniref:TRAP transporter permease n=1 Tax=Paenalcaligenes sp. Me131 TaxID=3392636 RepID=UPI003D2796E9
MPKLDKTIHTLGVYASATLILFIILTQIFGRFPSQVQYGTALMLAIVAITARSHPKSSAITSHRTMLANMLLILGAVLSWAYFTHQYDVIANYREGLPNSMDLWCYAIGTLVVIWAAHRAEGWFLTSVVLLAVAYLAFGHLLPGIFHHRPFSIARILEVSYSYRGIFGVALASVVDIVVVFVVLGTALRLTGAGDLFNDLALLLTRGRRSGPAQTAIIASAFFGSINGSAPANVAATGVLTIPMMKRSGFSARFAGGVEATASCVGQIMPPVMGVGAFIMSDITGIPYVTIMIAAILPALLYILSLSVTVALEAGRMQIPPLSDEDTPPWNRTMTLRAGLLIVGFGTLLTLLISGYPAPFSGLVATGVLLLAASMFPETRLKPANWLSMLTDSGRDSLSVLLSCAAIGIVIAAISSTGFGIKLNQEITVLGHSSLLLALFMAAICAIVLGMGLPTAASYLMVIFVAGPALMDLGVDKLTAHMFVFYYAVLSAITPPVALAVFAAAAIAKTNPMGLAVTAVRIAAVGFFLPLIWIYHPELLVQPGSDLNALFLYLPAALAAIVAFSAAQIGFLFRPLLVVERIFLAAGALLIAVPSNVLNGGAAIGLIVYFLWIFKGSKQRG